MRTKMGRFTEILALSTVLIMVLAGCQTRSGTIDSGLGEEGASGGGMQANDEGVGSEAMPEITGDELFAPATGLKPIYFDFDKYDLRPDALETLRANADKIKQVPGVVIQIEGHCDERGTQEYNLALGEKRALATRSHLMKLGVSGDRLITISYGEEDPADPGHNEAAWAKNRRSEFNRAM